MYTLLILLFATTLCVSKKVSLTATEEVPSTTKRYHNDIAKISQRLRLSANLLKSLLNQIEEYRVVYFANDGKNECNWEDELDDKAIKNLAKNTLRDLLYDLENPLQNIPDKETHVYRLQKILNLNDAEFQDALMGGNKWREKSCCKPTVSMPIPYTSPTKKKT